MTIGSFDSVGQQGPGGQLDLAPAVHRVMVQFGPQQQVLPGGGQTALLPKRFGGMTFDLQPIPVLVPRKSIGTDYARNSY